MTKPTLPIGSRRCQCPTCGEFFNSTKAFDMHREGRPDDRRCISTDRMFMRGMEKNKEGFWVSERFTAESKERIKG